MFSKYAGGKRPILKSGKVRWYLPARGEGESVRYKDVRKDELPMKNN